MIFSETVIYALILTTLAGLSTTFGSVIAIFYKKPSPAYMSFTMGFSAGVMILVSFMELMPQGVEVIGFTKAHVAFFIGIFVMYLIDIALPHLYILEEQRGGGSEGRGFNKTAVLVAIGIAIHNFPEGMATLAGTLQDVDVGIAMATAIAIHNIPEGIAVSVPVYAATKSAKSAFKWSFLSGVSEPVGALIAVLVLMPFLTDIVLGWSLCIVAGFMVFISLDELLPASHSYGREHLSIMGVVVGMIVMAASLAMLA